MPDDHTLLEQYARGAADRLGAEVHCSILLRSHGRLTFVGSSNDRARSCDEVEVRDGEGPCVTALLRMSGVLVPDIRADEQWPAWRQASLAAGFRSAAALPGYVDDETTVALNLYSDVLDPWHRERIVDMDRYVQDVAEAVRTHLGA